MFTRGRIIFLRIKRVATDYADYAERLPMTKRFFILSFLCGCLTSCDNKLSEKPGESEAIVKQSQMPRDTNSNNKKESKPIGDSVPVRTKSQILCDDEKGILLDYKKVKKYGMNNPYNLKQTISGDSTKVSFEIISNCHWEEYSGEARIVNDVLHLGYYIAKDSVRLADCDCDYRISYFIETKEIEGKKVKIRRGKLIH